MKRLKPAGARVSKSLVYAEYGDYLVFIAEPRARYLAKVWHAMVTSKTWGELKRLAPRRAYREIRDIFNDGRDPAEMRPNKPFDYYGMTGVPDGDYPGWPAQKMLDWMPADIQETLGSIGDSA